jgi:hypothetical protein
MARRGIEPDEERELARAAETASAEGADLIQVKASRGTAATAVLSIRMPVAELQSLRSLAVELKRPLADIIQQSVKAYVATGGAQTYVSFGQWTFYRTAPPGSESYNTAPKSQMIKRGEVTGTTAGASA